MQLVGGILRARPNFKP